MPVILQGSFAHFHPDQLLTLFSSFRHSGTLDVVGKQRHARVFFKEGGVIYAEGMAAAAVEEMICDLFVWGDGTFTFLDEAVLPDGAKPSINLQALIAEGSRRAEEWRQLLQLYPSEEITLGVVEDPMTVGQINLTPEEFKILMKIGSGRTLVRVRAEMKMTAAELYPAEQRLEKAGLVVRLPSAAETVRELPLRPPEQIPTVIHANAPESPAVAVSSKGATVNRPKPKTSQSPPLMSSLTASNGAMYPIVDTAYSIGRDASNEIVINDSSISSQHAWISRSEKGFAIEDAKSRNGTFVNGEKVTAPRVLADSDVVRLGKVVFTFKIASHMPAPLLTK